MPFTNSSKHSVVHPAAWAAGILGVLLAAATLVDWAVEQTPGLLFRILLCAALLLCGVYALFHGSQLIRTVRTGAERGTVNTAVFIASVIGIVLLGNFLSYRHHAQWDITHSQSWSLAPQTRSILSHLPGTVKITAYIPQISGVQLATGARVANPLYDQVANLLDQCSAYTNNVRYRMVDPDAQRLEVPQGVVPPAIVFQTEQGQALMLTASFEERDLAGMLLRIEKGKSINHVCFLTGDGENPLDAPPPDVHPGAAAQQALVPTALSTFKMLLAQEQYSVRSLDLAAAGAVPDDCDLLVIAGARQELQPGPLRMVQAYVQRGGNLLVLSDAPSGKSPSARLNPLLDSYGISLGTAAILGDGRLTGSPTITLGGHFGMDPTTRGFSEGEHLMLVQARPVDSKTVRGVVRTISARSESDSWGETHVDQEQKLDADDLRGPLPIAVSARKLMPGQGHHVSRVVAIGSVSMATDQVLGPLLGTASRPNLLLLSNAVNWLTSNEELLEMPAPPNPASATPANPEQVRFVAWAMVVAAPLLVLFAGGVVYWRRR